jgi:hypothetical protein
MQHCPRRIALRHGFANDFAYRIKLICLNEGAKKQKWEQAAHGERHPAKNAATLAISFSSAT